MFSHSQLSVHLAVCISLLRILTIFTCQFNPIQTPNQVFKKYLFLGFFEKDDDLKTEFMKAAGELREKYKFVHTQSEEVMADKGHREYVNLTFFYGSPFVNSFNLSNALALSVLGLWILNLGYQVCTCI